MKELSIEEKAGAYDEAYKVAESIHRFSSNPAEIKRMEEIFPELKESEDERIRKHLIKHFRNKSKEDWNGVPVKSVLAWLEKQGDKDKLIQELGEYKVKYTQEVLEKFMNKKDDERLRKTTIDFLKEFADKGYENAVECITWLKKQGEQKPANKVVPKFHEGDWVVVNNKHQSIYQVEKIEDGYYILRHTHGGTFRVCVLHDESLRLWNISDAKDGDVLCTYECDEPKNLFILKGTPKKHCALSYHCYYNIMYPHFESDSVKGCLAPNDEDVKPATKEQRETLMKAMADAGWEFDFDKKELKEIEQKPTKNEELTEFDKAVGVSIGTWNQKTPEQIQAVKSLSNKLLKLAKKQINNEQKSAWSDDDEQYLLVCKNALAKYQTTDKWDASIISCWLENKLKSLKPQSHWSEEDKRKINRIYSILMEAADTHAFSTSCRLIGDKECIELQDFLKSLKPQNTWKPNKIYLEELRRFYDCLDYNREAIKQLYDELKNL